MSNTAKEPKQNRYKSKQDYVTPWEFIRAVEARWGPLAVDLAASDANARAPDYFTEADDTFTQDWDRLASMICWLNCEFGDIERYAAKCARHAPAFRAAGGRILLFTPASIGSEWFRNHVYGKALVLGVGPRVQFEGAPDPYPKDLMLSVFGEDPGFDVWRWKAPRTKKTKPAQVPMA